MPTTEYLVTVVQDGRTSQHWFEPSESLRAPEDTDADAALWAAKEWHWSAQIVRIALSNGIPVTRNR